MAEICKLELPLHVDTVEFCPLNLKSDFLACGLYELDPETNQRRGGVSLLKIERKFSENNQLISANFVRQKTFKSHGVFELLWLPDEFGFLCAMANGSLTCYLGDENLDFTEFDLKIDNDRMLLNLDICQKSDHTYSIITSDNQGFLHLAEMPSSGGTVELVKSWSAHTSDYGIIPEVWCCTFRPGNENFIISGSENGDWKLWDLRISDGAVVTSQFSTAISKPKAHSAGVTCVTCHPLDENTIFTGGYDDHVKVWDLRNVKNSLSELYLGGGVWRIKFNPENLHKILCSCMYNGWALLDVEDCDLKNSRYNSYDGALLYGIDWFERGVSGCFATCTFYDNFVRFCTME